MEADRIIDLYRRHAKAWTTARGTELNERSWLDRFIEILKPKASLLDIGCGSGEPAARYLIDKGHSITGVDSSPEMITLFRANFPREKTVIADMRYLDLKSKFAGLIAWDSFFHLRHQDQRQMFPIFRDHAESLAPLLFTSGPAFGEAIGTLEGEPLYHASLDPCEYIQLLGQNGFELIAHTPEDPDCGGRTVWLACKAQT